MSDNLKFEEFKAKYSHLNGAELIEAARQEFGEGELVSFSSFGSYSSLLLDIIAKIDPNLPILFLETGKHFQETLDYVEEIKEKVGINNVISLKPDEKILANIDASGNLWQSNVDRCCWIRKVEPLDRYMDDNPNVKAVITGRRGYQTSDRAGMDSIELDDHGKIRINPFYNWSKQKIIAEFESRKLPQHSLVELGYPSIGCAPCTNPVKAGEDERSGRWAHASEENEDGSVVQKTECGIHLKKAETSDWKG